MLYDVDRLEPVTDIPHKEEYDIWISRLSASELSEIRNTLNGMIDGDKVHTSSWMPGADWTDTPFEAIYEKAARFHEDVAAKCFGLMVWVAFMERPEIWGFGHYEKNGWPIPGMTYFRLKQI